MRPRSEPEPSEHQTQPAAQAQLTRTVPAVEDLADRVRALIADEAGLTEKRMFGGLAFLVDGKMAVAASGQGGLLVRVDPDQAEDLIDAREVTPMQMRGKDMTGWLRVEDSALETGEDLERWVQRGITRARSLRS